MSDSPNLDALKTEVQQLLQLLETPEPGLNAWHELFAMRMVNIVEFWMPDMQADVKAFHDKMEVSKEREFATPEGAIRNRLHMIAHELDEHSRWLEENALDDPTAWGLRIHLCTEELAEQIKAVLSGNEVLALDAATDRLYVLIGTFVTMRWPLYMAFAEVHGSNMSKEKQPSDPHGERVRDKGPNFRRPDLEGILRRCRSTKQ